MNVMLEQFRGWVEISARRRRDRRLFRSAQTMAEVAALTAAWLDGVLTVSANSLREPQSETASIREVLADANRAGLLTVNSQPGFASDEVGQRAAVMFFAPRTDPTWDLLGSLAGDGMVVAVHAGRVVANRYDRTEQGWPVPAVDMLDVGRAAAADIGKALPVLAVDPVWGRNVHSPLWDHLTRYAASTGENTP